MKKSLTSYDKLKLKSDFDYVREHGTKYVGKYCLLVSAITPDDRLRCGVICSKKFDKRAVVRNRARRLLFESFRLLKHKIIPCHIILITRMWIKDKKQQDVQRDLEVLLDKSNFLLK